MSIDTLKASRAGFTDEQIEVLQDADNKLVTKEHLDMKLALVDARFDKVDNQLKIAIALGIAIFVKSFF